MGRNAAPCQLSSCLRSRVFDQEKGQPCASQLFLFCPNPGRSHLSLQIGQVRPCRGLYPVVHSQADSRAEGQQPLTIVCTLAGSSCKGGANQAGWSQSGHGVRLVPGLTVCVPTCTKPLTSFTAYPSIGGQHFSQHAPKLTTRAVVACFILWVQESNLPSFMAATTGLCGCYFTSGGAPSCLALHPTTTPSLLSCCSGP